MVGIEDPARPHDPRRDPTRTLAYVRLLAQLTDHQHKEVEESGRARDLAGRLRALVADYESAASRRVEARAMRTGEGYDDGGGGDVESERAAEKVRAEAERLLVELKK